MTTVSLPDDTDAPAAHRPVDPPHLLAIGGDLCLRTARLLRHNDWRCTGLRRRPPQPDTARRLSWITADVHRPETLVQLPSGVTHLLYAPAPAERTPACYRATYPEGLAAVLDALPGMEGLQRCVLVNSTAVWGAHRDWVDETTPPDPADYRGDAMLAAETVARSRLGVRAVTLRLAGLYGPGRTRLADALKAGRITAPTGPGHWANRIHIDDAAHACAHLLQLDQPLSCYIGVDDSPMPTAALYRALARELGASPPPAAPRPADGKRLSNARLRASGWTPQWPDALSGHAALFTANAT